MSRSTESQGGFGGYGGYGASRFDATTVVRLQLQHAGLAARAGEKGRRRLLRERHALRRRTTTATASTTAPPRRRRGARATEAAARRRLPLTIEGELVAKSTGTVSAFTLGDRVFHQKFGNGNVTAIDGNKLTIQFDRAGEKRVVDSFVEKLGCEALRNMASSNENEAVAYSETKSLALEN